MATVASSSAAIVDNTPKLWRDAIPWPSATTHKYDRGHAIVYGGGLASCGAAKLSARAALRVGAGLVSVACDGESLPAYAASFQAIMTKRCDDVASLATLISDDRVCAVLLGPGAGVCEQTRHAVLATLARHKPCVLDADALTVFAGQVDALGAAITAPCIVTPHAGEFQRLFGAAVLADEAAKRLNAVVVQKGHNTVIASPDGRMVINRAASPFLATAGSGDVLAGLCTGLLAQGMTPFDAACAAVWMHAAAAGAIGAGLIAEDLPDAVPAVLSRLYQHS